MLIHRGLKRQFVIFQYFIGLRAVLIHRGLKHGGGMGSTAAGLRAALIHRGLKPVLENGDDDEV